MNSRTVLAILAVVILGALGVALLTTADRADTISTFEECAARYPVMESLPRQCRTPDGRLFVENIGLEGATTTGNVQGMIEITTAFDQPLASPLAVQGRARGPWYFEASFPVRVLDAAGKEIGMGTAQAQGEWMTEEFVPFSATIEFSRPTTPTGVVVFEKANPSGLPENAASLRVPVTFQAPTAQAAGTCRATGCSGQICADEDVVTTCEFRPEYACYQDATCERQPDGKCGWTQTSELAACLREAQ